MSQCAPALQLEMSVVKKQSSFEEYQLSVQGLGLGLEACQDPVLFEFPSNIFIELKNVQMFEKGHTQISMSQSHSSKGDWHKRRP
jgi:hypothetical protein